MKTHKHTHPTHKTPTHLRHRRHLLLLPPPFQLDELPHVVQRLLQLFGPGEEHARGAEDGELFWVGWGARDGVVCVSVGGGGW
jgi:hypothetical protein